MQSDPFPRHIYLYDQWYSLPQEIMLRIEDKI